MIAESLNIPKTVVLQILKEDLGKRKLCPRGCNGWIKEVPKRNIFGSFSENVRPHKSLYKWQWSLFWIKKGFLITLL